MLRRLFYCSIPTVGGDGVAPIIRGSRSNNVEFDVTGSLVYTGAHFGQLIEGERKDIAQLLKNLQADGRHKDMKICIDESATDRWFPQWSMGYLSARELEGLFAVLRGPRLPPADELKNVVRELLNRADSL